MFVIGIHVYAGFAIHHSFHVALPVVVLGGFAYIGLFYFFVFKPYLITPYEDNLEALSVEISKKLSLRILGFPVFQL